MIFSPKTLLVATTILFFAVIGYKLYTNAKQDLQEAKTFFEPLKH